MAADTVASSTDTVIGAQAAQGVLNRPQRSQPTLISHNEGMRSFRGVAWLYSLSLTLHSHLAAAGTPTWNRFDAAERFVLQRTLPTDNRLTTSFIACPSPKFDRWRNDECTLIPENVSYGGFSTFHVEIRLRECALQLLDLE